MTEAGSGSGLDLGIMLGAHAAFRRDLERLARVAAREDGDPASAARLAAGWATFKRQLVNHHQVEDDIIWPRMREFLAARPEALSVLDEMEHEHGYVDPLLAAADAALATPDAGPSLADVVAEMTGKLGAHLTHEERDTLPLISECFSPAEWGRTIGAMMARPGAPEIGAEMFAWILEDADEAQTAALLAGLPQFAAERYRSEWRPAYDAVARW
jgi:iron-sulfur cluster repair protein YtfE (RIC family)